MHAPYQPLPLKKLLRDDFVIRLHQLEKLMHGVEITQRLVVLCPLFLTHQISEEACAK
jgi:hypothetical protein